MSNASPRWGERIDSGQTRPATGERMARDAGGLTCQCFACGDTLDSGSRKRFPYIQGPNRIGTTIIQIRRGISGISDLFTLTPCHYFHGAHIHIVRIILQFRTED